MPLRFGRLGLAAAVIAQARTADASAVVIAQTTPACYFEDSGPCCYWWWTVLVHVAFVLSFFYMVYRVVARASSGATSCRPKP